MASRKVPPLGLTAEEFITAGRHAVVEIERYYSTIENRRVLPDVKPGWLRAQLPSHAPEDGQAWNDISQDMEAVIMPGITHWQSPKYMAFYPASSTYPGILGELWSAALTSAAFNWICSPVVTELETIVLDWLAQIMHLPEAFLSKGEGGGVIQGSASEATLTSLVAARERFVTRQLMREGAADDSTSEDRAYEIRSKLVALASTQAHSSMKKGALVAGTRCRMIEVEHGKDYALTAAELRPVLEQLQTQGLTPFWLGVTIGTTNTCAVDDLLSIAEVLKDYPDIWIHCDAAYAGAALVLPIYQYLCDELSFVDSFSMNMHKWLLTNFDASPLYVKKRKALIDALSISPSYLKNRFSDSGLVTDYRDWQIPLGRRFRALKIWFVLRTWGVSGLRGHIQHHIDLGDLFADLIRSREDLFELLVPPRFALTVLTVRPRRGAGIPATNGHVKRGAEPPLQDRQKIVTTATTDGDLDAANRNTQQVYDIINQQKEYFITPTAVKGRTAIRIVSANPLAEEKCVREIFALLVAAAEGVFA